MTMKKLTVAFIYSKLKWVAKRRKLEFTITKEEYSQLRLFRCIYCGGALPKTGGIDRMDSRLGYVTGNVVPCCWDCNVIKRDLLTYDEMRYIMPLLKQFRKSSDWNT